MGSFLGTLGALLEMLQVVLWTASWAVLQVGFGTFIGSSMGRSIGSFKGSFMGHCTDCIIGRDSGSSKSR